jgi:phthiocerol/phenolphthiocerol synthesis type-I polyketide synthase E
MSDVNTSQSIGEEIADSIAIIGMAGKYPKADSIAELWNLLCAGDVGITIEENESHPADWVPASANFENPGLFDADFFNMSAREASIIDPQQRYFLEVCHQALESAGYAAQKMQGKVGVYAGVSPSQYLYGTVLADVNNHNAMTLFNGSMPDQLATRVAWHLNLKGPAMTISTACSTSLVALTVAVQQLEAYHCDMALVGGSCLQLNDEGGYSYIEGGIFSKDGKCRPFDEQASGTIAGSGVAAIVLKRTQEAIDDGDNIIAIIRSTALNNDGNEKIGYSAPSEQGQSDVIVEALTAAGLSASKIKYVEAHGTATRLGDPIELRALTAAYQELDATEQQTFLGSLKTNLGHLDVAAGVTGLIKAALVLKHKTVPPMPFFNRSNSEFDLLASPFKVNNTLQTLDESDEPLLAAVSSFGIGGTNAHVILQEAPQTESYPVKERQWHFLPVSAKNELALTAQKTQMRTAIEQSCASLADLSKTLIFGRDAHDFRSAFVCNDQEQIKNTGSFTSNEQAKVAFIFPGQGSQYRQMAYDLYQDETIYRQNFDQIAAYAKVFELDLISLVYGDADDVPLSNTEFTQPALFAVEYSLAKLLEHYGIKADAYLGHSLGEWVAATLSGVFSLEDAVYAVIERARLMAAMPQGQMLSIPAKWSEICHLLSDTLDLAVENTKNSCVIAGENAQIEQARLTLQEEGLTPKILETSHAYHSRMMEPVLESYEQVLNRIEFNQPETPWLSNITGDWIDPEQVKKPQYWCQHIRNTVLFADSLKHLQDNNYVCLEVGPGQAISRMLSSDNYVNFVAMLRSSKSSINDNEQFTRGIAQLWTMGVEPDWQQWFYTQDFNRISLPTYPFQRQEYWYGERVKTKAQPDIAAQSKELQSETSLLSAEKPLDQAGLAAQIQGLFNKNFYRTDIEVNENFFDLGGDSLLSISVLNDINQLSSAKISMAQFLDAPDPNSIGKILLSGEDTSQQTRPKLILSETFKPAKDALKQSVESVFITGATGFWGIHLIQELLTETEQEIVCLIRANSEQEARDKLQLQLQAYQLEFTACNPRIKVVLGDIGLPEFGLSVAEFATLSESIGRIYHLAAAVNHVYSFDALKAVNVDSVLTCLQLASSGREKQLVFASSIAVYSNTAYLNVSEVLEQPELSYGEFSSGYGETKWAAEQLIWQAVDRGFNAVVLRAGNITGHSQIGLCHETDAIWALIKACLLLNAYPKGVSNMLIDMLPVEQVCTATRALAETSIKSSVYHLVPEVHFTIGELLSSLKQHGYQMSELEVSEWINRAETQLTSEQKLPLHRMLKSDDVNVNKQVYFNNELLIRDLSDCGISAPQLTKTILTVYINIFIQTGFFPPVVAQGKIQESHTSFSELT